MGGRDVQPTLEQALRSSGAFQAAGSFISELALAPGPGPEPQAAPLQELRLGSLAILSRPATARDSPRRMNLAVVPSITSGLPSSNAWPARPRQARPRHILHPTTLRALQGVPSGVGVSALLPEHSSTATHGAAVLLKTGADFPIGYMDSESFCRSMRILPEEKHRAFATPEISFCVSRRD